jgi:hypothetical protein
VSDIDTPADPKGTMGYRAAKLAVIVLSALIILALIGLVVGGILKLSGHPARRAGNAADQTFALPPGARIVSSETQPGRLILHVRAREGDEIDIVSLEDGHLILRIGAAPPAQP